MLHLMIFVHNILTQKSSDKQNTVCFHGYCRSKKLRFSFLQERVFICLCNSPIWFDYICACASIAYISNHSTRVLQDNSWTERSGLKIFVHFVGELFFLNASKAVFMFNNHQVTLKFTQKLVSEFFLSQYTRPYTHPRSDSQNWQRSSKWLIYYSFWYHRYAVIYHCGNCMYKTFLLKPNTSIWATLW